MPLDAAQAHYLSGVMRQGPGADIEVFNGRDGAWTARIEAAGKRGGAVALIAAAAPQQDPPDLWLLFAPIKKARTDFIVEKAAELGAARIQPVQTDHTNAERIRQDRLQAHAIEAAEQCGGTFVPPVADLAPLATLDLGRAVVAAVPDPAPAAPELASTRIARGDYVNAGLLVMNLAVWRADDIAGRCRALLTDPARPLLSEDQSALNIAAAGRILPLPSRFNVYADPAAYPDATAWPQDPAVIHHVVGLKPWIAAGVELGGIWDWHAARIGDLMPPRGPVKAGQRLSALNRQRKLLAGLAAGRGKYRARWQVRAAMRRFAASYLARRSRAAGTGRVG